VVDPLRAATESDGDAGYVITLGPFDSLQRDRYRWRARTAITLCILVLSLKKFYVWTPR
jgi:hypothetical protein